MRYHVRHPDVRTVNNIYQLLIISIYHTSEYEKINKHGICQGRRSIFFEISPHHNFGLSSGPKRPKFRATFGEPKRYFVQIVDALMFIP